MMATTSSSLIVIKVMFGEKLSRFTASVNDKKLDLDIVMLSDKIRRLFSFGSDVEFSMTYVDEDGDVVTLAHDDDLLEVIRQSLNPLRITVKLIDGNKLGGSSGTSAPLGFPFNPFQSLNPLHYQQQYQAINPQVSASPNSPQVQPWFQLQTLNSGTCGNLKSPPYQLPYQTVNYRVAGERKSVHDLLPWATRLKEEMDNFLMRLRADPIGSALNVDDQQGADSKSSTLKDSEDNLGGSSGTYAPLGFPFSSLENLNWVRCQPQLQFKTLNSGVFENVKPV